MFTMYRPSDPHLLANAAITQIPASDPLYKAVYKAEKQLETQDYITITDLVNQHLLVKGVDLTKLGNHSFLNGSAIQKYYVMDTQYVQLKTEIDLKTKAEYEVLVKNANNAINTVLSNPAHPLYARLLQAKTKASERDYIAITKGINNILSSLKVDYSKLNDKTFLNGSAFQAYYLLPSELTDKMNQLRTMRDIAGSDQSSVTDVDSHAHGHKHRHGLQNRHGHGHRHHHR